MMETTTTTCRPLCLDKKDGGTLVVGVRQSLLHPYRSMQLSCRGALHETFFQPCRARPSLSLLCRHTAMTSTSSPQPDDVWFPLEVDSYALRAWVAAPGFFSRRHTHTHTEAKHKSHHHAARTSKQVSNVWRTKTNPSD